MRRIAPQSPWFLIGLLSLATACGEAAPANESEAEVEATVSEVEATPSEVAGTPEASAGLLNANLASAEALASAGLSSEAVASIVSSRPVLRASELHAQLLTAVGETEALEAYNSVWLPINLNDVTEEEVLLIPGVGDRMAHEFEEYRPYEGMAAFRREMAKYVDDAEVDRLAQYVFVPIDLNTASREDILMIPGMDDRMAHEFEEYRPYSDLDQFRREMAKYVDADEVARLERYVTLPLGG